MEEVHLPVPTTLYHPGTTPKFAHFMTSGMVSIVTFMKDGHGVEVGLVGSESLVEAFHLLGSAEMPTTGFLQVEGWALRLPYSDLVREFGENKLMRSLILKSVQVHGLVVQQLAACNRLHEVEERMSRWLLTVSNRLGTPDFAITQEFLAQMIGTQRTTVTLAAGNLQRSGLIEYRRGRMTLLDRERLESAACECYPIVRDLMLNMYK